MADANNKKELSMEQRLLLAFVLMGAVIFLTPYILPKPPVPAQPKQEQKQAAIPQPVNPSTPAPASPAKTPAAAQAPVTAAAQDEYPVIDTDLFHIKFSNRGGVVLSWVLKKFKDTNGQPLDLVNPINTELTGVKPFSYLFQDRKPSVDLNNARFAVTREGNSSIRFEFSDGKTVARKSFQFTEHRYMTEMSSSVLENSTPISHLLVWRGGFGDETVAKAYAAQHSIFLPQNTSSPTTKDSSAAKDGPVTDAGNYVFAGLQDTYFAALFLPKPGQVTEIQTLSDTLPYPTKDSKEHMQFVGAAIGGAGSNDFKLYVGPKDLDVLGANDSRLESVVDWGWFGWIARPMFKALRWLHDNYVPNWGWAIIVLTALINFALLPLKFTSMKSMKKMQALQPQIQAINDRYKNVSLKDPRKAEQNAEVMELYKKNSVNPAGGCVPLLLQFPFFIGFYKVLAVAIELRGAPWLWVPDLAQPETLAIRVLPLLMIASQFLMQRMTPSTGGDPAQQKMMMFMPLMFGFLFYNASSGLVLYWLTGNVVGVLQQLFFNRLTPAAQVTAKPTTGKKQK